MAIRIGRGAAERIIESRSAFAVQVRHATDLGAAIGAMKLARVDLLGLARGRAEEIPAEGARPAPSTSVSPVVSAPDGPIMLVERLQAEDDELRTVPDVVAQRLEQAGVESATVEIAVSGGPLDRLDSTTHAVVLRLFPTKPSPNAPLPVDWLDIAGEWVTGDLSDDDPVLMRILSVESRVPASQVAGLIHECGGARAWCDAVNGELGDRIRTASITFGLLPHLALAAGGPSVDSLGLIARYDLLVDLARELAPRIGYACIDFEPTFEGLGLGLSPEGWEREGGAPANVVARDLLTEWVPDAFPYQVLGPGHLAHLGDTDLDLAPLGDRRAELELDDPRSWLAQSPDRPDARREGWAVLRPLLVRAEEVDELVRAAKASPPAAVEESDQPGAMTLDMGSVLLTGAPHGRRGSRLTLLELSAWLGHEAHSDAPAGVSPVLATYARWLGAGLSDEDRQELKGVAGRLVGTGDVDVPTERARSWMAAEWLVRVQAPAWLRAAGMLEAGDRLAAIGTLTDDLELVRAVELLGTAIAIASRRIEVTASLVEEPGAPNDGDDSVVWEAWEEVADSSGWVAASEAATHAAPAELVYATDLRVIECSRDPRARTELEASRQSVGDSAWATALHAMADEAWERGWRAADGAARELSGFTIRIEMGRAAKTVLAAEEGDDLPELALEQADRAARDALTRAALRGGVPEIGPDGQPGEHPWDEARNVARTSEGGHEWSVVIDEARRAVGEDGWAQGMADARSVVTSLLAVAPDTVARVVVASVAREACSAAGRGVALRAAAVARANGARPDEAATAARDALEQVAASLRSDAIELLDRLIAVDTRTSAAAGMFSRTQ